MALQYDPPPEGALRQGEILTGVHEHRVLAPAGTPQEGETDFESIEHPVTVILTADCDLESDFGQRFSAQRPVAMKEIPTWDYGNHKLAPYTILCGVYTREQIKRRFLDEDLWDRVEKNDDKRYHFFPAAPVQSGGDVPPLYIDFKKVVPVPTDGLYSAADIGTVARLALVPTVYVHDMVQRFYAFHSRIGQP